MAIPNDLPLRLVAHRPDIVAARWEIEEAAQAVGAARVAFYPDVNIALFAGWNSVHLGDLLSPGNLAHALGPVITLPIFEGGALRAEIRAQNALYLVAQDHYRTTILHAVQEIADRLRRWQQIREKLSAQTQMTRAAGHRVRLDDAAFHAGIQNRLGAVQAQIAMAEARAGRTTLETASIQSWVLLNGALGGGYKSTKGQP